MSKRNRRRFWKIFTSNPFWVLAVFLLVKQEWRPWIATTFSMLRNEAARVVAAILELPALILSCLLAGTAMFALPTLLRRLRTHLPTRARIVPTIAQISGASHSRFVATGTLTNATPMPPPMPPGTASNVVAMEPPPHGPRMPPPHTIVNGRISMLWEADQREHDIAAQLAMRPRPRMPEFGSGLVVNSATAN